MSGWTGLREGLLRDYGRKQGLLRTRWAQLQLACGRFEELSAIDWPRVARLLFVCTGNICRSPYAEARARRLGAHVGSFGLRAGDGRPADPKALRHAAERGIDLRPHRSRGPRAFVLGPGDLLAAMEPAQLSAVRELARPSGAQVTLAGVWAESARPHLEDPFGLSDAYFVTCFAFLDRAVEGLVRRLPLNARAVGERSWS